MSYPWLLPHKKTFIGQRKTPTAKVTLRSKGLISLENIFPQSIQICLFMYKEHSYFQWLSQDFLIK